MKHSYSKGVIAIVCMCPAFSFGQTIFNSLDVPEITGEVLNSNLIGWAQSFVTGNDPIELTHVELELVRGSTATGAFGVELWSNSSGLPSTSLSTFNGTTSPVTGINTFVMSSSVVLQANTAYWIAAFNRGEDPSNAGYFWLQGQGNPSVGSHIGTALSYTGNGWTIFTEGGVPTYNEPMSMRVNGVPEPATLAALSLGTVLLGRRTRRRH